MLKPKWLDLILDNVKDLEIRRTPGHTVVNERIWLCQSGSKAVFGYARVAAVMGPLTAEQWAELRPRHGVEGGWLYGTSTFAWVLTGAVRLERPLPIERKPRSIGTQVGPGF